MSYFKATIWCTKFDFGWGSAPDLTGPLAGGAYSAPQTPYLDFRGPTSKGSEGRGKGEKGKGMGGNEKGKGRKGRQALLPPPSQFATPLGQASPSRRPGLGLWVTWPGLRIFWPRNDLAPLLRWRRHCYSDSVPSDYKTKIFSKPTFDCRREDPWCHVATTYYPDNCDNIG